MGEKGEGSGGDGGGKWGERGRELGMWYPPVHPLILCTRRLQPPRDDCNFRVQRFSGVLVVTFTAGCRRADTQTGNKRIIYITATNDGNGFCTRGVSQIFQLNTGSLTPYIIQG